MKYYIDPTNGYANRCQKSISEFDVSIGTLRVYVIRYMEKYNGFSYRLSDHYSLHFMIKKKNEYTYHSITDKRKRFMDNAIINHIKLFGSIQ